MSRAQPKIQSEMSVEEIIAHRSRHLTAYQNAKLAARYRALVDKARMAVAQAGLDERIVRAVAVNYSRLLAYKDEYEVARLYLAPEFRAQLTEHFDGDYKLGFNLAPPFLPGTDPNGRPLKREFGPWMMAGFRVLASLKGLRATPFDIFGRTHDRREERQLISDYEGLAERVLSKLNKASAKTALDLLSLPEEIRGFGPIKAEAIARSRAKQAELLAKLESVPPGAAAATAAKDEACSLPA
jgi:indolepyruvate ferredoxin oxidoreductase